MPSNVCPVCRRNYERLARLPLVAEPKLYVDLPPLKLMHCTGARAGAHQLVQGAFLPQPTTAPRNVPHAGREDFGREANKYSEHEQQVALYNDEELRLASGETMSRS